MSYEKQTWQTGDVVTSAKLNHMEDGIAAAGGGGVLVVNVTASEVDGEIVYTCDKTAGEIYAACPCVFFQADNGDTGVTVLPLSNYFYDSVVGYIFSDIAGSTYSAVSSNDYPASSGGK